MLFAFWNHIILQEKQLLGQGLTIVSGKYKVISANVGLCCWSVNIPYNKKKRIAADITLNVSKWVSWRELLRNIICNLANECSLLTLYIFCCFMLAFWGCYNAFVTIHEICCSLTWSIFSYMMWISPFNINNPSSVTVGGIQFSSSLYLVLIGE